ncbi:MAG TPA: aldo/keto reductase [Candidatus Limnocylindria bacterium]|nr:aldo/keto reductase [Candidatus Limnocylindria bacterium]
MADAATIRGFATAEGTAGYRARRGARAGEGHFRTWRGLTLSSLGIGTYLGAEDEATDRAYEATVRRALELGFNVVDSAINYRHQRSERNVGAVLRALAREVRIAREDVLLATKGGFMPHPVDAYVKAGIVKPDEVVGDGHCIAPRFLADQLDRSRANLGVETIDVYFVHNPETQLGAVDQATFLARMRAAFEFLEGAVRDGKIRWYGAATWTGFRQPATAREHLSLPGLVGLAREVAGDGHHFGMIQLPYNLAMTEAITVANQRVGAASVPVMQAAEQLGVYVMTSASILQGKLARNLPPALAQVLEGLRTDAQRALQFVRSTPGVGTALCGMRSLPHVEENAGLVSVPPVPSEKLFSQA